MRLCDWTFPPNVNFQSHAQSPLTPCPIGRKNFQKKICDWTAKLQSHDSVAKRVQNSEKNSSQMLIFTMRNVWKQPNFSYWIHWFRINWILNLKLNLKINLPIRKKFVLLQQHTYLASHQISALKVSLFFYYHGVHQRTAAVQRADKASKKQRVILRWRGESVAYTSKYQLFPAEKLS